MMRLGAEDERPTLHGEDELTSCSDLAVTAARYTAAELTASAYGPLNEWAFVAPSSASAGCLDGLGLFARVSLRGLENWRVTDARVRALVGAAAPSPPPRCALLIALDLAGARLVTEAINASLDLGYIGIPSSCSVATAILSGIAAASFPASGWNVRLQPRLEVVRLSPNVLHVIVPQTADYDTLTEEVVSVTLPACALRDASRNFSAGSFSITPTERSVGCTSSMAESAASRPGEL